MDSEILSCQRLTLDQSLRKRHVFHTFAAAAISKNLRSSRCSVPGSFAGLRVWHVDHVVRLQTTKM